MEIKIIESDKRIIISGDEFIYKKPNGTVSTINVLIPFQSVGTVLTRLKSKCVYPFSHIVRLRTHLDNLTLDEDVRENMIKLLEQNSFFINRY